jgi:hypothetical protein
MIRAIWFLTGVDLILATLLFQRFEFPGPALGCASLGCLVALACLICELLDYAPEIIEIAPSPAPGQNSLALPKGETAMKQDPKENFQLMFPESIRPACVGDASTQAMEKLRPQLVKFAAENPFLGLAPVPKHSHEFQGWIFEVIKRRNLRSHTLTEEAQTRLAAQIDAFYTQIVSITQKHNEIRKESILAEIELQTEAAKLILELNRVPKQARVENFRIRYQAAQAELDLLKVRGETAKLRRQLIIDIDQLDAKILAKDQPQNGSAADREATRLQQEINKINEKIANIAGLEQACAEMKSRSPETYWPLIDRLFRKVIDSRKENL